MRQGGYIMLKVQKSSITQIYSYLVEFYVDIMFNSSIIELLQLVHPNYAVRHVFGIRLVLLYFHCIENKYTMHNAHAHMQNVPIMLHA